MKYHKIPEDVAKRFADDCANKVSEWVIDVAGREAEAEDCVMWELVTEMVYDQLRDLELPPDVVIP